MVDDTNKLSCEFTSGHISADTIDFFVDDPFKPLLIYMYASLRFSIMLPCFSVKGKIIN